jgi:phosphatidylserine/phosphatidylglycerophosphate/cardiolipin synthase-like enzyme
MRDRTELCNALDTDRLRRLGAALWFGVGTRLRLADLAWAMPLLGEGADQAVWESLHEAGVLGSDGVVQAEPLARWLGHLASGGTPQPAEEPVIVWTLPAQHPAAAEHGSLYADAILDVVNHARRELLMTSPFMQEQGVRHLISAVVQALHRGVSVTILTHGAEDLASAQSVAVEEIRREAERLGGWLSVYTAATPNGSLLHAKLVVADHERVIIGSANLTGPGLAVNLEAGVVLGRAHASEASRTIQRLIEAGLARKVFSTAEDLPSQKTYQR